jgi:hypothetical protein
MSKQKQKGTKAESDVVKWGHKHGFFQADRLALTGSKDRGDVRITEAIMVQVKDGYTDRREPTDYLIGLWLDELGRQQRIGGYYIALLVHKRYGKADPDDWRWYMEGQTFMRLMGHDAIHAPPPYIQLQGYMIPPLLRNAGVTA